MQNNSLRCWMLIISELHWNFHGLTFRKMTDTLESEKHRLVFCFNIRINSSRTSSLCLHTAKSVRLPISEMWKVRVRRVAWLDNEFWMWPFLARLFLSIPVQRSKPAQSRGTNHLSPVELYIMDQDGKLSLLTRRESLLCSLAFHLFLCNELSPLWWRIGGHPSISEVWETSLSNFLS